MTERETRAMVAALAFLENIDLTKEQAFLIGRTFALMIGTPMQEAAGLFFLRRANEKADAKRMKKIQAETVRR